MEIIIDGRYRVYPLDALNWTIDKLGDVKDADGNVTGQTWRRINKFYPHPQYAVALVYDQMLREKDGAAEDARTLGLMLEDVQKSIFGALNQAMPDQPEAKPPFPADFPEPPAPKPRARRSRKKTATKTEEKPADDAPASKDEKAEPTAKPKTRRRRTTKKKEN